MNIEYRHPTEVDIGAMTEVMNLGTKDLKHHADSSADEIRAWTFGEKDYDPEGYLLAFADGRPVAYGGSMISKSRVDNGFKDAHINLMIVPEWRGKGIEKHIIDFALVFIRSKGMELAMFWAPEKNGWRNDVALAHGMRDIRHGYMMFYDRKESPPCVPLPEGYAFHHRMLKECSDAEIEEFVGAFNDSFFDHWNFSPAPTERFIKVRDVEAKNDDSILRMTLAKKGDEAAGVCYYCIYKDYNRQNYRKAGWVNILGVRKPHRRKGLGRSLLAQSMEWLREQSMETIYLGMDAENRKALELYTSLGYQIEDESVVYELKL